MNELQIFNSPEFERIRTVVKDGEPWFVGKGQIYFVNRIRGGVGNEI